MVSKVIGWLIGLVAYVLLVSWVFQLTWNNGFVPSKIASVEIDFGTAFWIMVGFLMFIIPSNLSRSVKRND